jgi:hypothetical protein
MGFTYQNRLRVLFPPLVEGAVEGAVTVISWKKGRVDKNAQATSGLQHRAESGQ